MNTLNTPQTKSIVYYAPKNNYFFTILIFLIMTAVLVKINFILPLSINSLPLIFFTTLVGLTSLFLIVSLIISVQSAHYDGETLIVEHRGFTRGYKRSEILKCSFRYIKEKATWSKLKPFVTFGQLLERKASEEKGAVFLRLELANGKTKVLALNDRVGEDFANEFCACFK